MKAIRWIVAACGVVVVLGASAIWAADDKPAAAAPAVTAEAKAPAQTQTDNPFSVTDPYAGVFVGADMSAAFVLDTETGAYAGTLTRGGATFKLTATREGEGLKGAFTVGEKLFAFTATLHEGQLRFQTGNALYKLTRRGVEAAPTVPPSPQPQPPPPPAVTPPTIPRPTAPSPTTPPSTTPPPTVRPPLPPLPVQASTTATITVPAMTPLRDTSGLTILRPAQWRVKPDETGLFFVGDDFQGRQVLHLMKRPAEGDDAGSDQAMTAFFDQYVSFFYPTLKRADQTQRLDTLAGPGLVATYQGALPTGEQARLTAYGVMQAKARVCLFNMTKPATARPHERTVRLMFASLGWGVGAFDERVAHAWFPKGVAAVKAPGAPSRPAVQWRFGKQGWCDILRSEAAPTAAGQFIEHLDDEGVWSVSNGKLHVVWGEAGAKVYDLTLGRDSNKQNTLTLNAPGQPDMQLIQLEEQQ
jgi:hypothetical protein